MSDRKNICMLPWVHLHTWPNGNVYPCCLTPMEHIAGNLNENSLEEIYNSDLIKDIRVKMIDDERPEPCNRCYHHEDAGGMSMRHRANTSWSKYEHMIDETKEDGTVEEMKLPYWDFRFSNICNFKCRSCGPQLSTGWYPDIKKIAVMETGRSFLPDDIPKNNKFDLWEQIEPYFEDVEEIYFAGGEPLIMEEHYRILKKLDSMGRHDVLLRYNTNFSEMRYKDLHVLEFWPKFKNVEVGASIDGMGEEGEFIRSGFSWQQFKDNRTKMKQTCPHVNFYVSSTISIQNAYHIVPFHHTLVEGGWIDSYNSFNVNIVTEPNHLDIRILPQHHKVKLEKLYQEHIDMLSDVGDWSAKQGFDSLKNHLMQDIETAGEHLEVFKYKMKQVDKIREENFSETFPEMSDLYGF
jgi:radical SAM protein with 4Fe4S-binding SPASM domain